MARRKNTPPSDAPAGQLQANQGRSMPTRVLIVSGNRTERMRLASRLADGECGSVSECGLADSAKAAIAAVEESRYDLAIIRCDLPDGSGVDLSRRLTQRQAGPATILLSESPTLEQAVEAMRSGALDIVSSAAAGNELVAAMRSAFERARRSRARASPDIGSRMASTCRSDRAPGSRVSSPCPAPSACGRASPGSTPRTGSGRSS